MEFTEKDFSSCRFAPTHKDLLRTYPPLKEISDDERLLKYIICLYQSNSPLHKEYPDLNIKKQAAAIIAGYDLFNPILIDLFGCGEEYAPRISTFLRQYGDSRLWSIIVANTELFYEFQLRLISPIKEDRDKDLVSAVSMKSKMSEELEKIHARIESAERKFYGGDEKLFDAAQKVNRYTPENIANV